MLALWVLVTHVMYMQDYWRTWLKGLRGFFFVGVLFSAVSVATFCTFLVLAVTRHQSERCWGTWGFTWDSRPGSKACVQGTWEARAWGFSPRG